MVRVVIARYTNRPRREVSIAVPTGRGGTASGRPKAVAYDERDGEVGPARSSREASKQGGLGWAELVERRGGAKENAKLQSTVRTLSRIAVSQAQARIREPSSGTDES
jgi:hypothetical protein